MSITRCMNVRYVNFHIYELEDMYQKSPLPLSSSSSSSRAFLIPKLLCLTSVACVGCPGSQTRNLMSGDVNYISSHSNMRLTRSWYKTLLVMNGAELHPRTLATNSLISLVSALEGYFKFSTAGQIIDIHT